MLTVEEFYDLGVEFVAKDKLLGHTNDKNSAAVDIGDCWVNHGSYSGFIELIEGLFASKQWIPSSFAWRPLNTLPDNPKFKYEKSDFDSFWRPLLDQSQTETKEEKESFDKMKPYEFDAHFSSEKSVAIGSRVETNRHSGGHTIISSNQTFKMPEFKKPVFTQAMADAGERVKVGMLFSTATGKYTALMVNDSQVVFEHGSLGFVIEKHVFIHPIDTRTPKQKAVDEIEGAISDTIPTVSVDDTKLVIDALMSINIIKC